VVDGTASADDGLELTVGGAGGGCDKDSEDVAILRVRSSADSGGAGAGGAAAGIGFAVFTAFFVCLGSSSESSGYTARLCLHSIMITCH